MGNYFNFQSRNYYDADLNLKLLANQNKWQGLSNKSAPKDKMDTETFFNGKTSDGIEVGNFLCESAKLPLPTKETKENISNALGQAQEAVKEYGSEYYAPNYEDSLGVQSAKGAGAYCLAVGKSFAQLGIGLLQLGNKVLPTKEEGIVDTAKGVKEIGSGLKEAVSNPYDTFVKPIEETWKKNPSEGLGEAYGLLFQTAIGAKGAANGIKAGAKTIGKKFPNLFPKKILSVNAELKLHPEYAKSIQGKTPVVKGKMNIPQKYIDAIKKERPHLSPELQEIYAKRLMRAEKTGSPWQPGPVDDYEKTLFQKFMETDAGRNDVKANLEKVAKPTDKHVPVQKMVVSDDDFNLLLDQYQCGGSHIGEEECIRLSRLFKKAKPLEEDCVVYRGIVPERGSNAFIDNLKEGSVITRDLWTSTSTSAQDWTLLQFHSSGMRCSGKGYMMRVKLPKGTKGIDYRGIQNSQGQMLCDGAQTEYVLPPNSRIKINKIDYANQIMDCEYELPKTENYIPSAKSKMEIPKELNSTVTDEFNPDMFDRPHTEKTHITYKNRKIDETVDFVRGELEARSLKTDISTDFDGTTSKVVNHWDRELKETTITKTIEDANGNIIFHDKIN